MTEVLARTALTAPELLTLCDVAILEQDYVTAYHHASMAYRAAVGDIEQCRLDPTPAYEAAIRAALLSARLNYSEMSTIMWIYDGASVLRDLDSLEAHAHQERIYLAGVEALGIQSGDGTLAPEYAKELRKIWDYASLSQRKLKQAAANAAGEKPHTWFTRLRQWLGGRAVVARR